MKKTALLILLLVSAAAASTAFSQVEIITARIKANQVKNTPADDEVSSLLAGLKPDGSWGDINYDDRSRTNWDPVSHSRRLLNLCKVYNKSGSRYYHSDDLRKKIQEIIEFYIVKRPESNNWWYNAIGAPTNLAPALVLMKPENGFGIDQRLLEKYTVRLVHYYTESAKLWPNSTTGANKIWLLSSSIGKACVMNNAEVLRENFASAFEEARIMPGRAEGIKSDMSFYQHGPQLYGAGYGMSFLNDITTFGVLAHSTEYAMTPAQLKVLTDAVLDGWQWMIQHSSSDFSAAGREISRHGAVNAAALGTFASRLIEMDAPRRDELRKMISFIEGDGKFQSPGNRHFWKSDIMVHHGTDWYISARIPSKRVYATERMNDENLKRKWLPWGAMNIMKQGDEYRNIYAIWDWSRIPGVTSYLEEIQGLPVTGGAYLSATTDFAGGVTDGKYGMAAYDYSFDGVSSRKSWFFTPSGILCLGAGITASGDKEVVTSINQCFSSGEVIVSRNRKVTSSADPETVGEDLTWVWHDGFGYYFPVSSKIVMRNADQTGSWNDINTSQSRDKVTGKVFSLWVSHGEKPAGGNYEYAVAPLQAPSEMEGWIKRSAPVTITNTTAIQAVQDKASGLYAASFFEPGTVQLRKGLKITVSNPCLLLVSIKEKTLLLHASDPTQKLQSVIVTFSVDLTGENVLKGDGNTSVTLNLPAGDDAGKTMSAQFGIN